MKKIIFILVATFALTSCGNTSPSSEATVDSTEVAVDSVTVDTVAVDTTVVAE